MKKVRLNSLRLSPVVSKSETDYIKLFESAVQQMKKRKERMINLVESKKIKERRRYITISKITSLLTPS